MRFTAGREELSQALKLAMACAERKSTVPILGHVLVEARGSLITITASDMDRQVSITLPAEIQETGSEAVNGNMLADISAAVKGDDIILNSGKDGRAEVKSGRSRYQVPVLPADDFPKMPQPEEFKSFVLSGGHFSKAIADVAYSADTIDTRPYLCGVFVHAMESAWAAVTTDGKRLSFRSFQPPMGGDGLPASILPSKSVSLLGKLYTGEHELTLECGKTLWTIRNSRISFTTKLIDGNFPEYARLIPDRTQYSVKAAKSELLSGIVRAAIATDMSRGLKMEFLDNMIRLSASQTDGAESFDEIEADGPFIPYPVGIPENQFRDAINMMEGDNVIIGIDGAANPIKITDGRPDAVCVIVPVRI